MIVIPKDILASNILDNDDFDQLKTIDELPNETDVNDHKLLELSDIFIAFEDEKADLEMELHKLAKQQLKEKQVSDAWKTLLAFNN